MLVKCILVLLDFFCSFEMMYLLETAVGYALFDKQEGRDAELVAKHGFADVAEALECSLQLGRGEAPASLVDFLRSVETGTKETLAVEDQRLAETLSRMLERRVVCVQDEVQRGARMDAYRHFGMKSSEYSAQTLCIAHRMSAEKIKLVPEKIDTMVIQSVSLLGDLDKDINMHCMRLREWYGFHFPELSSVVENNKEYLELVLAIGRKETVGDKKEMLEGAVGDKADRIVRLAGVSMGVSMSDHDMENILGDARSVLKSFGFKDELAEYIRKKMEVLAPNLTVLVGEVIGAKMIGKAGSLSNLAKMPASTIQILGAEKALFQALKLKSNTPKYGMIYGCSLLGQTPSQFKGKIARTLASKAGIAARIDGCGEDTSNSQGTRMKEQVEQRIKHLETRSSAAKKSAKRLKHEIKPAGYDDSKDFKRIRLE